MAKSSATFVCQSCGTTTTKWSGRCDACGEWNCIVEEVPLATGPAAKTLGTSKGRSLPLSDLSSTEAPPPRTRSGLDELDRVLGGGVVPSSALLVGGDPGIIPPVLARIGKILVGTANSKRERLLYYIYIHL